MDDCRIVRLHLCIINSVGIILKFSVVVNYDVSCHDTVRGINETLLSNREVETLQKSVITESNN